MIIVCRLKVIHLDLETYSPHLFYISMTQIFHGFHYIHYDFGGPFAKAMFASKRVCTIYVNSVNMCMINTLSTKGPSLFPLHYQPMKD